jgi:hypothetical protein
MSETFKSQFTRIEGLSSRRRLPRLGKIRLGVKAVSKKTGHEYPRETPHFVVPSEVEKVYGKTPTALDVMFPINDPEVVFPQAYKFYGSSKGLKCIGNGRIAHRASEDGTFEEIECPCDKLESGECGQRASLMVILPKVNLGGVYQIDIGSFHSIVDINSGIDYVKALMKESLGLERFAMIPLVLKREPRETHHDNKKQIHYTLNLHVNLTIDQINQMKSDARILNPEPLALPAVEEINPKYDEGAVVVYDEENGDKPAEAKQETAKKSTKKQAEKPTDEPKELLATQEQFRALAQIEESILLQPFEKYLLNLRIADPELTAEKAKNMINYWTEEMMKRTEMKTKDVKKYYRYVNNFVQKLINEYPAEYNEFIGG